MRTSHRSDRGKDQKATITIAVESAVLDQVKADAAVNGMSVNALIDQVLTKYELFHKHAIAKRCVFLPRVIHESLLRDADEEKVIEIMISINNDEISGLFKHNNIPPTLENLKALVFDTAGPATGLYNIHKFYEESDGSSSLLFEHRHGIKWSRIIGRVFCSLIVSMTKLPVLGCEVVPSHILIRVRA